MTKFAYLAVAAMAVASTTVQASENAVSDPGSGNGEATAIFTNSHTLKASLDRIAAGSRLWRQAVETVRRHGRRAVVLTSDRVVVAERANLDAYETFDSTVLAEVAPVPHEESEVHVVVVIVNLDLLEQVHHSLASRQDAFEADLDRILVHEVFGHALPYLLLGNLSGRCADPQPGQPPADACSICRENAVRAELRLGQRTDYGLESLSLAEAL